MKVVPFTASTHFLQRACASLSESIPREKIPWRNRRWTSAEDTIFLAKSGFAYTKVLILSYVIRDNLQCPRPCIVSMKRVSQMVHLTSP